MIPLFKPSFTGEEISLVTRALESGWVSDGDFLREFESGLSRCLRSPHVLTSSSGTASLHLALQALGIGPGDEVIIPSYSFAAPANIVRILGGRPVFAPVDPDSWLLDPGAWEELVTAKTRAIVAVHLYGNVCDMGPICQKAREKNIAVVEDVAQAFFSSYAGQFAGTFGAVGCFSFQATKIISTGEGGAVCTGDESLFKTMTLIRNHGMGPEKKYWHALAGHNFRLTNLQGALGVAQLKGLAVNVEKRRKLMARYRSLLSDLSWIVRQSFSPEVDPVFWALPLKIRPESGISRDAVMGWLKEKGIETRPGFHPFDEMPGYGAASDPVGKEISKNLFLLPFYPDLSSEEVEFVAQSLRAFRS